MNKKTKKADIDVLVKENANVDRRQLEEAIKLIKILSDKGIKRSEYSLISPYSRIPSGKYNV
jgi:hypothetical protein